MPRHSLPATGPPDSTDERRDPSGALIQRRSYGSDGRASKNIDYNHDHGAGVPHAHDWDWARNPPRGPGRPLDPGE